MNPKKKVTYVRIPSNLRVFKKNHVHLINNAREIEIIEVIRVEISRRRKDLTTL